VRREAVTSIDAVEVVKRYGPLVAVDRVTFQARRGEVLGLLGPNGAGKSTLMRVLAGYLAADEGRASIAGHDVATESLEARAHLGYLPESAGVHHELRVEEYLAYRVALKGVERGERAARVDRALAACDLRDVRRRIVGQLSKGYRQRVALAACLLHDPEVVILDEPSVGLDPNQAAQMRRLVRELGRERCVLFSTHVLTEAEAVCDRVLIVDRGRIVAEGTLADLTARHAGRALSVELVGEPERAVAAAATVDGAAATVVAGEPTLRLSVVFPSHADAATRLRLVRALAAAECTVIGLAPERSSLEDVFARVTHEGAAVA
jgi:ABC-2 type transport system ATP-binding protein